MSIASVTLPAGESAALGVPANNSVLVVSIEVASHSLSAFWRCSQTAGALWVATQLGLR